MLFWLENNLPEKEIVWCVCVCEIEREKMRGMSAYWDKP